MEVGTSYYAVAVVKRSSHVTIDTLKGVKSCHTGINRTVGWNVPVGYLVESGHLSVMGCDVLKGAATPLLWVSPLRHSAASPVRHHLTSCLLGPCGAQLLLTHGGVPDDIARHRPNP
ncbi:hypothetical protein P7K49_030213 [Saguinus oedipus]|uniref:Transferrin-like domain-containing protein n=1 Tax=Saguinus oedipus TaxID=9490 RepID=A0ABQ9U1K8_SAGOE|nr:hypothetical protein P7K49_030213 [Saguinus oedipus]